MHFVHGNSTFQPLLKMEGKIILMCNLLFSNLVMLPKTKKTSNEMLMCQFNLNLDEKNSVSICLQYIIIDVDSQKKLEFDGVRLLLLLLSCYVYLFQNIKEKYFF